MSIHYTARITYSNNVAAQGVQVRIFDRDAPGMTDDDLTITPGVSDVLGYFTVEYDSSRAQDTSLVTRRVPKNPPYDWTLVERTYLEPDPNDDFQPYLRFTYTVNGQDQSGTASLIPSQGTYQLPQVAEKSFLPSVHGFKFVNSFSGVFLPFALPTIPGLGNPNSVYGLCGGMSASALDFWLANHPVPLQSDVPENGTPLQRYLYKRQIDSLGRFGDVIIRFAEWMGLPDDTDHGTQKRTQDEFEKIRTRLNRSIPVPIGLLYVKWTDTNQVWQNHQVLATSYIRDDQNHIQMSIYDPNFPMRDDILLEGERVPVGNGVFGLKVQQRIGASTKKLYAFFAMPYQANTPPLDLTA